MEEFVKRIVDENNAICKIYYKTIERRNKLEKFITSSPIYFDKLSNRERQLLVEQLDSMDNFINSSKRYISVLQKRLELYIPDIAEQEK